ncbi:hypothetical protein A0257_04055 [Hymenobacter psoromatis]|nr:hypothetical protein A0257_04055 [Hymenobacter psoromatis]
MTSRNILYYGQRHRVYPFLEGAVAKSLQRGIAFRYQVGPGVAYRIYANRRSYLRLGAATLYEQSRFEGHEFENYAGTSAVITKWREQLFLAGTQVVPDGRLRLNYELNYQPAFQGHNLLLAAVGGLELPVGRYVALRTNFQYSYETVVLTGKQQGDLLVTFGFTITNIFKPEKEASEDED